ncbi:hypothetical protein RUM43_012706 [Polyplax serrata]|uniref:Uncharacterized protein n=1 Tax=Polyplax serrata TaxID=468196 RepID=A0AAN8P5Z8_POLSC
MAASLTDHICGEYEKELGSTDVTAPCLHLEEKPANQSDFVIRWLPFSFFPTDQGFSELSKSANVVQAIEPYE